VGFSVPCVTQPTREPSSLLWECNTFQQHSSKAAYRLKSRQMLLFFASPHRVRVPALTTRILVAVGYRSPWGLPIWAVL